MRRYWQFLYCVPAPLLSLTQASYFPLWIKPRTLHLQLWMGPIRRFLSHISQGHEKVSPPASSHLSSTHTSLFSHEMTPLFNQLWIMKFCTRDPFSLHLTVIELHSHAIPFTTAMRRKGSGGGAASLCSGCVYVAMCQMKAISQWHHGPLLNGTATEGPFCASSPRGPVAQWDPTADL